MVAISLVDRLEKSLKIQKSLKRLTCWVIGLSLLLVELPLSAKELHREVGGKDSIPKGQGSFDIQAIKEVSIEEKWLHRHRTLGGLPIEEVNSRFIRQQSGGSLGESLASLPGVQAMAIGSGQTKPMIRGLGFNQVAVIDQGLKHQGQEWGVDHGLEIDQFRIGLAQIVKGPAAFRYGSGAIGGAVVLHPDPVPVFSTSGGALNLIGKTNNGLYGGSLRLFQRRKKWHWETRVTGWNHGDFTVPTDTVHIYNYAVGLDKGKVRNTAGREAAFYLRTGYQDSLLESTLSASMHWSRFGFFANAHGLEPRQVDVRLHDRSHRDIQMPRQSVRHLKLNSSTRWEYGDHQLLLNLGIQHNFRQEHSPYVNHGYMPPIFPDGLPFSRTLEREYDKMSWSAALSDRWTLAQHRLQIGVDVEYQDNEINGWSFLTPGFGQLSLGLFVFDEFEIDPGTVVSAALRYDYGDIRTTSYRDWFESGYTDPAGQPIDEYLQRAESLDRVFEAITWALGVRRTLGSFTAHANLGTAFRMPIAKELAANGVNYHYFRYEQGNTTLSPERSYQLDIGGSWSDHRWTVRINPFFNYFSNYIYLNPTSQHDYLYGAGNQVFQYTETTVFRWGGEARFDFVYNAHWEGGFAGELLFNRQLSGSKKGFTLPFSPPPALRMHVRYQPGSFWFFNETHVLLEHKITASQRNIVPPEKHTPGSQTMDFSVGGTLSLGGQQVDVGVKVLNVWNTEYYDHLSFYRLIDMPEAGRNIVLNMYFPF